MKTKQKNHNNYVRKIKKNSNQNLEIFMDLYISFICRVKICKRNRCKSCYLIKGRVVPTVVAAK